MTTDDQVDGKRYLIDEDSVNLHKAASTRSPLVGTAIRGESLEELERVPGDDIRYFRGADTWVKVKAHDGAEAFAQVTSSRFFRERVAFIVAAGFIVGPIIGMTTETPALAASAAIIWFVAMIFLFAKMLFGVGGFFEHVPKSTTPARFDWSKFALEPLRFIGVAMVFGLGIGAIAAARACAS